MEEAVALRAAAKKKVGGIGKVFTKIGVAKKNEAAMEEAQEMYTSAGNLFLREREFAQAAECFAKAAATAPSVYTAAALHVEAAQAWRSAKSPEFAVRAYAEAIALFARHGPLRRAALVCVDMAKLYDEQSQFEYALKSWTRAVTLYDDQHDALNAAQARLGAADAAARVGQYQLAIQNYEAAAEACSQDRLTKFKLKQYFLKAGLCYLAAGDLVGLRTALDERFRRWDRAFTATLEYRLLGGLGAALQEQNIQKFEHAMYVYDQKHRLDKWQLEMSMKVKQRFSQRPEEELL